MVEATNQLNYTLNSKVTAANKSTIISGTSNNGQIVTTTTSGSIVQNINADPPTDFNVIAANCNTNVCFFCQKTFTNVYNCRRHIRTHSGEKPFECKVCGKKFSRQSTLNAHEKVHTGNQIFKCETCSKAFDIYRQLTEHQLIHRVDKPFTCKICNKSYSRATVLSQHMKSHSTNNTLNTMQTIFQTEPASVNQNLNTTTTTVTVPIITQPLYKCQQCEKMFVTPSDLKDHEQVHIVVSKEEKKIVTLKEVVVVVKPDESQVIQLMPQISFNTESDCIESAANNNNSNNNIIINSRAIVTDPTPIVPIIQTNMNHPKTVTVIESPMLQPIDEEMDHEDEEITYEEITTNQERLNQQQENKCCTICNKQFKSQNELQIHAKIHLCDKFKCDVCDRKFSILSNFNAHKRIHERIKPFRCSICGKSFRLQKSLTVHMVIHTESSITCPICDRQFGRSSNLKTHMKTHTSAELQAPKRTYIDVMCYDEEDGLFGDDDENNGPMLEFISDLAPTYCDICGKKFIQSHANIRTHKCSKYNNDDEDFDEEEEHLSSLDIWNCD